MTDLQRPPGVTGMSIRYTGSFDAVQFGRLSDILSAYGSKARALEWMLHFLVEYLNQVPPHVVITEQWLREQLPKLELRLRPNTGD